MMTEEELKRTYNLVLKSGMFWEFYPELTGNYEKDRLQYINYRIAELKNIIILDNNPYSVLGADEFREQIKNLEKMKYSIKEKLRIAQILASEYDCVPDDADTAYQFLTEVMGEEVEKDLVQRTVGTYMGYSAYDIDQEIYKQYFNEN